MEDGSGKCLLDVISDPSALSEFLESNHQALLDGDSSLSKGQLFQNASVSNQVSHAVNTSLSNNVVSSQQQFIAQTSALPRSTVQNVTSAISAVSMVNTSNLQTVVRSINGPINVANSSGMKPINSKSSSPINNLVNVTKGIAMSPVTYQGKKPIPIQPKNPVILPSTSIQSGVNVLSNVRPGLASQTPTSLMTNQLHGGVLPRGSTMNGVDSSKPRTTPVQPRTSQPTILSTPPKRIAPKQVISPSTTTSHRAMSPVRIQQANLQNKQNIQVATQLLQAQNTASASSNPNKPFSQQLATVVQPMTNNNASSVVKSSINTAQPVQQIQQLINDKLSGQQAQPLVQAAPVQQKVFTQTQLETALKQSQLIAQNSPGQQQNILVQQQILKQLIQQAQQLQQQKTSAKTAASNINVQPVTTYTQGIIQQPQQQVRQVVPQQVAVGNQLQMVLPNQQILTLAQNALQTNQQSQNAGQTVSHVNAANLNHNIKTTTQPMIIVSQSNGSFVLQQNLKPTNSGSTTSTATTINIPLQSLLNQQQKQIASQLVNTPRTNQSLPQQGKVSGNTVLQVNQPKQVGQQTILIQNQVGQAQNVAKPVAAQQNVVIQAKPNVSTTQPNTTIQQLTAAQLQQIQNMGGVQKVLIIKQPEVVQKLANSQGTKVPQAIQITPQQLQVLQQIQNPQTSTTQKIIIQNKSDGSSPSTTILTAHQLKQLQQSLQQQGSSAKIIQIPQGQRQVLVQQVQQQNNKTQGKMAHVPRILQTSGRQPTNQASKTSIKQEPNRGVKRPHADTPEPPKVVRRLKSALYQDQQGVLHPDIHTPFKSRLEAIKKLSSYHVCHDPGQTPQDVKKSEEDFENVASHLIKISEKMMEKYRNLMLTESTRQEASSEMVMLYRLYLADERASLAQNKQQLAEELKILRSMPQVAMPPPSTPAVNSTTSTNNKKTPESSQPTPTKPRMPSPTLTVMETDKELDILTADALLATPEDHSLLANDDDEEEEEEESSDVDMEENEIDKAVFNMESSTSYYEPVNHLSDSLIDSPQTSTPHNDGDDSVDELLVDDDDVEKEDVTATLALLHSMAEELDGAIS